MEMIDELETKIAQMEGEGGAVQWLANEERQENMERIDELETKVAQMDGERGAVQWLHNEERQEVDERIANQDAKIITLEMDKASLRRDADDAEAAKTEQEIRAVRAERRGTTLTQANASLNAELQMERERVAEAQRQLEQEQARSEGQSFGQLWRINELRGQITQGRNKIGRLEQQIRGIDRENTELILSEENSIARMAYLNDAVTQRTLERAEQKARGDRAEARNVELEAQVKTLDSALQTERENLTRTQKGLELNEGALDREITHKERLEGEIQVLQGIIGEAFGQALQRDARIQELLQEIKIFNESDDVSHLVETEEEAQLKEQVLFLEKEKAELIKSASEAEVKLGYRTRHLNIAREQISSLNHKVERERNGFLKKTKEYRELQDRFHGLDWENRKLRRVEENQDLLGDRLLGQLKDNKTLRQTIQDIQKKAGETIKRLRGELVEAQRKIKDMEAKGKIASQAAANTGRNLAAKEKDLRQTQTQLQGLRGQLGYKGEIIVSNQRRESYLERRLEVLTTEIQRMGEQRQAEGIVAADRRKDYSLAKMQAGQLERDLRRARENLLQTKEALDSLKAQDSLTRRELGRARAEAAAGKEARVEAMRTAELLRGKRVGLDHAREVNGRLSNKVKELEKAAKEKGIQIQEEMRQNSELFMRLTEELAESQALVEKLRKIEQRQAENLQILSEPKNIPEEAPPQGPERGNDLPPVTVRILELGPGIPSESARTAGPWGRPTPPFTPTPEDREHDLAVLRADLDRTREEKAKAEQDFRKKEDDWIVLENQLSELAQANDPKAILSLLESLELVRATHAVEVQGSSHETITPTPETPPDSTDPE
jgi:chromosome segregation ATPase